MSIQLFVLNDSLLYQTSIHKKLSITRELIKSKEICKKNFHSALTYQKSTK